MRMESQLHTRRPPLFLQLIFFFPSFPSIDPSISSRVTLMGPLHKSPPYFIPSTSNGPSRLSARSRLNKRRRRRRNQCPHLSGENDPRMEFIDGDQLRRGGVEAGGQAGQRVVALDRVGQRVLRQAAVAAAADAAASARSPFTDAHRTTGTSSAVCNNKKRRNKNQSISCTIEKSL